MRRPIGMGLVVLATVVLPAGCGSGTAATTPVPQLHVRVQTSGAFTYRGSYAANAGTGRSCTEAARRGNGTAGFVVGAPGSRSVPLYFAVRVPGYRGPATYHASDVGVDEVLVADHGRETRFQVGPSSPVVMSVSADGSGTATLSGLVATNGATMSASLQWTCVTERWRAHAS